MYCDLWLQYIQVWKLFKGGNYSRAETIWGNMVHIMYFFYYTTRPALCKELHSVLAFILTIKYQMIGFISVLCIYTKRVLCRNALCVLLDLGCFDPKNANTVLALWRFLHLTYKFQRMALRRTLKYASPSLFLRRPAFSFLRLFFLA